MAMNKGESKPLNVTKEAQHRVVVGLGWDPADAPKLIKKIGSIAKGRPTHHDLDLSCFMFDEHKAMIGKVSADGDFAIDESGKIYHSGDNVEGLGDGDDEEISVELKDIPPIINSIIFTAHISTGQSFGSVNAPEMRIYDAYTGHNFLHHDLSEQSGADKGTFVFISLQRSAANDWSLHYIGDYPVSKDQKDWEAALQSYLA